MPPERCILVVTESNERSSGGFTAVSAVAERYCEGQHAADVGNLTAVAAAAYEGFGGV